MKGGRRRIGIFSCPFYAIRIRGEGEERVESSGEFYAIRRGESREERVDRGERVLRNIVMLLGLLGMSFLFCVFLLVLCLQDTGCILSNRAGIDLFLLPIGILFFLLCLLKGFRGFVFQFVPLSVFVFQFVL